MPIFWWGLLLIIFFSGYLGWTPVSGRISLMYFFPQVTGFMLIDSLISGQAGAFKSALTYLILPTVVLATIPLAVIARQTRSAMLEVLGEDYVRTARAKGLSPFRVIGVHALRNAMIPVITTIGLQVGVLLAGAILTETIFSWPGIGKWMVDSVFKRDYAVVQGGSDADRCRHHDRQPRGRPALRLGQPAYPALGGDPCCTVQSHGRHQDGSGTPPSGLSEFWFYFSRNKGAVIGLAFFLVILFVAVFAPIVAPHSPSAQNRELLLLPPVFQQGGMWGHILGTDAVGRDILSRLIYGARFSLFIGLVVVTLSVVSGVLIGLIAGYFRGRVDTFIMRVMDIILAFPSLLLALVLVAVLGPGLFNAMIAISLVNQPHFVRLTRAAVMTEKTKDYVVGSKVAGAGTLRLMFLTILPNCLAPLIVQATLAFSARSSTRRRSASSAWARSRRRRNGARCSPKRANSSSAPGGSSPSPASPSSSPCWPSTSWVTACATPSIPS
jgi:dipeptide transport system permease protein